MAGAFKKMVKNVEAEGKPPVVAKKIAAAAGFARYGKKIMEAKAAAGRKKC
jgi:hypothetical protein